MNAAVVKRTQDMLGKVIQRPSLTEKLLNKPPFNFLRDVFAEVIRSAGFMKGLYGETELKSTTALDKQARIAFLQKAIDVVMLVTGEPLAVKPVQIVVGHEPEKTNEMLQAIARCCLNKLSSDDAVRRVLAGERFQLKTRGSTSKSRDKENSEGCELHLEREITEHGGSGDYKESGQRKDQESRQRSREKEPHRDKERSDRHYHPSQEHHAKDKNRDQTRASTSKSRYKENGEGCELHLEREENKKITERDGSADHAHPGLCKDQESRHRSREKEPHRDKEHSDRHYRPSQEHHAKDKNRHQEGDKEKAKAQIKDQAREKDREREKDKERNKDREKRRDRNSHKDRERDRERQKGRDKEQEKRRDQHKAGLERKNSGETSIVNSKVTLSEKPQKKSSHDESSKTTVPVPKSQARIPRPSSAKGQRRRLKSQDGSDSEKEGDASVSQNPTPQENGDAASSSLPYNMASSYRQIPRPSSARPAPPRIKKQETDPDVIPSGRVSSAKTTVPVILDGKTPSDDKDNADKQFVVEEVFSVAPDFPEVEVDAAQEINSEEQHGGLVKKILETKRDYELSTSSLKSHEQNVVSEVALKMERNTVMKEVEQLGSSIQMICRSITSLRKVIDYMQEDIDAMQAEGNTWRVKCKDKLQACQEEQRMTDHSMEPLYQELAEVEELINDQQDLMSASKANILKNEEMCIKLITGVIVSSRA